MTRYMTVSRQVPWSVPKSGDFETNGITVKLKKSRIPNPYSVHLIWDGMVPVISMSAGMVALVEDMKQCLDGDWGPEWINKINTTYCRHTKRHQSGREALSMPGFGPNALLADGHVERTADISNLTEENGNFARK